MHIRAGPANFSLLNYPNILLHLVLGQLLLDVLEGGQAAFPMDWEDSHMVYPLFF